MGEAGRRWWYALSVAAYVAAMFYHPKAAPVIVAHIAYCALVPARSPRELLAPRTWLWLIPYVAVAAFTIIVGYELRLRSPTALFSFRYGPHVYTNYVWYLRMALWPHQTGAEATTANRLPACLLWFWICLWMLSHARRREHAVALVWFFVALVPLTSAVFGASPRELYVAGPALALILAAFAVSVFDALAANRVAVRLAAAGFAGIAVYALSLTTWNAAHQGGYSEDAHAFITQLQREQPALSASDTLYVVHPPQSLSFFGSVNLYEVVYVFYPGVAVKLAAEVEATKIEAAHDPSNKIITFSGP